MSSQHKYKTLIVAKVMDIIEGWHCVIHREAENRFTRQNNHMLEPSQEYKTPEEKEIEEQERQEFADKAKAFYYSRMTSTATLLLAVASVIISIFALLISLITG